MCQRASYDRIIMPNMANVFFYNDLTYTIGKDHLPYDRTNYVRGHFLYDLMCTHYVKGHLPFDLTYTNFVKGHFLYDLMCTHYVKGHLPFDLTYTNYVKGRLPL